MPFMTHTLHHLFFRYHIICKWFCIWLGQWFIRIKRATLTILYKETKYVLAIACHIKPITLADLYVERCFDDEPLMEQLQNELSVF